MQESKLSKYKAKVSGLLENVNKVLKCMKVETNSEPNGIQENDSGLGKKSNEREPSISLPATKLPSIKSTINNVTSPSQESIGKISISNLIRK